MKKTLTEVKGRKCFKCLLESIGATLMGVKPAKLRSIKQRRPNYKLWKKWRKELSSIEHIEIVKISENDRRRKVFFYHKAAMNNWLVEEKRLQFLREFGYPKDYELKIYISFLIDKLRDYELRGAEFPHEIGIFLGYPLKDVLGFIDYIDLEPTCRREWKVYGNKSISIAREEEFEKARDSFARKLEEIQCLDEIYKLL